IRLRCRAHNQYAAECTFGEEFMRQKREEARRAAAGASTGGATAEHAGEDVVPWLRQLGFNMRDARSAAALCSDLPDASLEERLRVALRYLHPRVAGGRAGMTTAQGGATMTCARPSEDGHSRRMALSESRPSRLSGL